MVSILRSLLAMLLKLCAAKALKLPEYIQTQGFSRREWYPRLKLLKGRKKSKKQRLLERLANEKLAEEKAAAAEQDNAKGVTENASPTPAEAITNSKEETTQNSSSVDAQAMIATHRLAPKTIGMPPRDNYERGCTDELHSRCL